MAVPFRYSLRNLWLRRSTTLASMLGIGLVVFVLAASRMLATGLRHTLLSSGSEDKALVLQLDAYDESASRLKHTALAQIMGAPGVLRSPDGHVLLSAEAVGHVYLSKAGNAEQHSSVQVRGVSDSAYRLRPEIKLLTGRLPRSGTHEAMVGVGLAGQFSGLSIGQGFDLQKNRRLEIVGVFTANGSAYESEVWADLDTVRSALGFNAYLSSATVQLTSARSFEEFAQTLQADKRMGLTVERERTYYARVSNNLARVISGIGGLVSVIFACGAMLGAAITLYGAVNQRRREIGVLRAIGFTRLNILLAVLLESATLALAGGLVGVGLASLTQFVRFSTINWATGQELVFPFRADTEILLGALLAGTLVGVLGGLLPALQAARLSPINAMRR